MPNEKDESIINIRISEETRGQIEFLSKVSGATFGEMAEELLADQAEAEAGLSRGPYLRKYMYR